MNREIEFHLIKHITAGGQDQVSSSGINKIFGLILLLQGMSQSSA